MTGQLELEQGALYLTKAAGEFRITEEKWRRRRWRGFPIKTGVDNGVFSNRFIVFTVTISP